jgi:hypothetical protein
MLMHPAYLARKLHLEPTDEKPPQLPVHDILSVGIALIGILYLALYGGQIVDVIARIYNVHSWDRNTALGAVRQGVWLLVMLSMVARHRQVADWILRVDAGARATKDTNEDKTN